MGGTEIVFQTKINERTGANTGVTAKKVSSEPGRAGSALSSMTTKEQDKGSITEEIWKQASSANLQVVEKYLREEEDIKSI